MKLILTGCTGFVGTEILEQCIAHQYIEHIFCIARRELDAKYSTNKKVTQVVHDDFEDYNETLLNTWRNQGVDGCIWALGGRMNQFKTVEEAQKVGVTYPTQAAEAFAKHLGTALSPSAPPNTQSFPFRFVFISGWGAEQDPHRRLWIWSDSRKIKGAAEKGLFEIADQSEHVRGQRCFEVISLRPGGALAKGETLTTMLTEAVVPSIGVDRLARCAIKTVLQGTGDSNKRVLENAACLGDDWAMMNTLTI